MLSHGNVRVKGIKGVAEEEIRNKNHNIWIGISLSNKFFNKVSIRALIEFALAFTKEKVLVWVPGRLQATNFRYFDDYSRAAALRKGFEIESEVINQIREIIKALSTENIIVANYDDVCTPKFIKQREILYREFSKEGEFYKEVIGIVKDIISARQRTYTKDRAESLALYVLSELPLFIDGIQKIGDDTTYTVIPYPGFGKMDELEMELVAGSKYPELSSSLKLENRTGIMDIELA